MGTPGWPPRLRVAAEWLSLVSLVLGFAFSSSDEGAMRWLGLTAMATGALVAWFSHVAMRAELGHSQADAQAWRNWLAASDDAVLVLGAPRQGWSAWTPRQETSAGPVVLQANPVAQGLSQAAGEGPRSQPATLDQVWPLADHGLLADGVYRAIGDAASDEAGATAVHTCEVTQAAQDRQGTRHWLHRVMRCGDRVIVQTQDVTAFRVAQRALIERETFYRTLVDSLPMGVLARSTQPSSAGQYLVCNRHAADVLGVAADKLLGSKGDQWLPSEWLHQSDEQDLQVLREPRMHRFEGLSLSSPGGERIIDLIKAPVYDADGDIDHILVIAQDVTEQRRAADQLRLASRVIDETGDAVVVTDAVDRVVMVNPSFLRLANVTPDEVIGQSAELLGLTPLRESHLPGIAEAIRSGARWSGESHQLHRAGRPLDTWQSVSTLRNARGAITQHIRVFSDISALKSHQRELAEQARRDALTGLPNRRAFSEHLVQAMARARRSPRSMAVLFIDLDGFKAVNDLYGHAAGDHLLVAVAERLQECVRETDTVCRLAGDEFTVILEGAGQADEVHVVCQRILERLCVPHHFEHQSRVVSPSIGVAVYQAGETAAELCERADGAMYAAKRGGKSAYVLAEQPEHALTAAPTTLHVASVTVAEAPQPGVEPSPCLLASAG